MDVYLYFGLLRPEGIIHWIVSFGIDTKAQVIVTVFMFLGLLLQKTW